MRRRQQGQFALLRQLLAQLLKRKRVQRVFSLSQWRKRARVTLQMP
jgi:hypothetical protein